jgi:hypothetical protein
MEIITENKKVQKRSVNRKGSEKSVYGAAGGRAPYYDPYDNHVHVWTTGSLVNGPQNSKSKFCSGKPKQFNGRYCKVCHEVKYPFYQTSDTSIMRGDPYYVRNLREAMKAIKERPINNWKILLTRLGFVDNNKKYFDFNKESKLFELLTLEGAECSIYKHPGTYTICKVIGDGTVDVSNGSMEINVQETLVTPIYNIPKYAPIAEPPRFVEKPSGDGDSEGLRWKQRWETYKKWKVLQEDLKLFLSEKLGVGIEALMERNIESIVWPSNSCKTCRIPSINCSCWRLSVNLENCNFLIKSADRVTRNYVTVADN